MPQIITSVLDANSYLTQYKEGVPSKIAGGKMKDITSTKTVIISCADFQFQGAAVA